MNHREERGEHEGKEFQLAHFAWWKVVFVESRGGNRDTRSISSSEPREDGAGNGVSLLA